MLSKTGANRMPHAGKQAGHENRRKEQDEWSNCSGQRDGPDPEGERTRYRGDAEEIPNRVFWNGCCEAS